MMMPQTPKRTSAKGKGRAQTTTKGCCCKRSQCIKNYCDCYQSMMVCTQFCRCVGCRNTEERMAVEPRTPSRNSNTIKKDRGAAMSAKAAAAAAKEGFNMPVPSISKVSMPVITVPVPPPTVIAAAPMNIIRMAPETFNVVLQQHVPAEQELMPIEATETVELEVPTTPEEVMDMESPEVETKVEEPDEIEVPETHNLFLPNINEAMLMCALIQGSEAEQVGLHPPQVGRLAIVEFTNCFKEVCERMLNF